MEFKPEEWVGMCPENLRTDLKRKLECPPGTPGSADVYGCELLDTFKDDEIFSEYSGSKFSAEERKKFRQYAEAWGKYAEAMTAQYLLINGYTIREWDWSPKNGKGEIDIIAQKGSRIIFVEVKARCGRHSDPYEAIDDKKIRSLCRGADIYLKMQKEMYEYQFDVALIRGTYEDYDFEYIEDAFLAPLSRR